MIIAFCCPPIRKLRLNWPRARTRCEINQIKWASSSKREHNFLFRNINLFHLSVAIECATLKCTRQLYTMNGKHKSPIISNWVDIRLPLKSNYQQHHCTFPHFGKLKCIRFHQSSDPVIFVFGALFCLACRKHCKMQTKRVHKNQYRSIFSGGTWVNETLHHKNEAIKEP